LVLRGHLGASSVTFSLKDVSLTVAVDEQAVMAWDRAGRLYSTWKDGTTLRRGLNGHVLAKGQSDAAQGTSLLGPVRADAAVDEAASLARRLLKAIEAGPWQWAAPPAPAVLADLRDALDAAARFTARAAVADAARFAQIYSPIGILPPDQYLALVIQATDGCSFSTCTFCDLYQQPFRLKLPAEFAAHMTEVRAFLGRSIGLRGRSVFLGSANALALPMSHLRPVFDAMASEFDTPARGVCAFLDAFSGARKDAADYGALGDLGLRRVYIGLESGDDELLAFVRKAGTSADAVEAVRAIKAGGVHVGVIVMIGLGGDHFAGAHAAGTAAALNAMGLGPGDLIYFSHLVEAPATPYPRLAAGRSIRSLGTKEMARQRQTIQNRLTFAGAPPQLANYDVREFVY
jgi:hypothetical protein